MAMAMAMAMAMDMDMTPGTAMAGIQDNRWA